MERQVKYLLVGGGLACVHASVAIRERDKEGSMLMVCGERHMPYDHPPLSKNYLINPEMTGDDVSSKFDNYYPDNNIELVRGVKAEKLDPVRKQVKLADGSVITYEKLLIATGARPKRPDFGGSEHVMLLGSLDESTKIREAVKTAKRAAVLGGGFIGVEVAATLAKKGIDTTLLVTEAHLWDRFASPTLASFLEQYLTKAGVKVFTNNAAVGAAEGEVLAHGSQRIPADLIVAGWGVDLNTEFPFSGGLFGDKDGVTTNEYLQTSHHDIYVAGDIARFTDHAMGKTWHLEHFLNAKWQGQVAGANMTGEEIMYDKVPYWFSDFLDIHMVLRGDPTVGKNSRVLGDLDGAEFVELYADDGGFLRMGVAISREEPKVDAISDKLEEMIRAKVKADTITGESFGL